MRLFTASLCLAVATLAAAGCDQKKPGEPLVRTPIRSVGTEAQATSDATSVQTDDAPAQMESSCRPVIFENSSFTHCLAVPSRHRISTALAGADGKPLRGFAQLAASRGPNAPAIAFAMNGGMFGEDGQPIGYYVQNSQRTQTLNTRDADGNFYMKPNGVFFGDDTQWQIRTTDAFLAEVTDRPEFGTQSGPMLVVNGKLHPDISSDGESRLIRNAVGVDEEGRAHFVISNAPVSFGKLARLYRDKLEVDNALYLDGNVSALWSPANGRMDSAVPIGPLIVVEKRAETP